MTKKAAVEESDVLFGMKAICVFLGRSEATVQKWMREYEDFPVRKNGTLVSSRRKLNAWFAGFIGIQAYRAAVTPAVNP
jgi:hypothetical protein